MNEVKANVFLICPVRNVDRELNEKLKKYVEYLESERRRVYWPTRDTDQTDPIGYKICKTNFLAMFEADEIHVWYDESSAGSKFDLGGLFAMIVLFGMEKKVIIVNNKEAK